MQLERIIGTFEDYEAYKRKDRQDTLENKLNNLKLNQTFVKDGLSYKENGNMKP